MPRSLQNPKLSVRLSATLQNRLNDRTPASVNHPNLNYAPSLDSGVDANQASRGWQSLNRELGKGATESLDLSDFAAVNIGAGVGLDGVGQAVDYEEVVAIAVVNENAVDSNGRLEIVTSGGLGWTPLGDHTVALGGALRGQSLLLKVQPAADGFDIDPAGARLIAFTAVGDTVFYSIYLLTRHEDEEQSSSSSSRSSISTSSESSSSQSSGSSESSSSSPSSSSWSSTSSSSSLSTSSSSSESSSSVSSSSWSSQS